MASLCASWYSITREASFIDSRIDHMLERRLERWTPDEVFELVPILLQVSLS